MVIRKLIILSGIVLILGLSACEQFEGDQTVPAYLYIDTIYLEGNPVLEEGFLTHDFRDVWVYVDDQTIGAFELPATIPILQNGKHKVALYAGVIYNGISGTRGNYLFTQPRIYDGMELFIDSVLTRNPTVSYYDNTEFLWVEDFEGAISMVPTSNSDTTLLKTYHDPADPFLGLSSGIGYLTDDKPIIEMTTYDSEVPGYEIPTGGIPVFLEIEYNTNNILVVGIFVSNIGSGGITQHPVVVFHSSEGVWKKAYVNLSPAISAYSSSDYFNVYIRSDKVEGVADPVIIVDNLKLLKRVAY